MTQKNAGVVIDGDLRIYDGEFIMPSNLTVTGNLEISRGATFVHKESSMTFNRHFKQESNIERCPCHDCDYTNNGTVRCQDTCMIYMSWVQRELDKEE